MNSGFLVRNAISSFVALSALILPAEWAQGQQASYTGNAMMFNSAEVGVSGGSAQTLTATFSVSGYVGSFTPTAALHYGHDYTLGTVGCAPNGASESCTVPVTFQPRLPGSAKMRFS